MCLGHLSCDICADHTIWIIFICLRLKGCLLHVSFAAATIYVLRTSCLLRILCVKGLHLLMTTIFELFLATHHLLQFVYFVFFLNNVANYIFAVCSLMKNLFILLFIK